MCEFENKTCSGDSQNAKLDCSYVNSLGNLALKEFPDPEYFQFIDLNLEICSLSYLDGDNPSRRYRMFLNEGSVVLQWNHCVK